MALFRSAALIAVTLLSPALAASNLALNDKEYFETRGLNVTVFADYYPDGHQTGVTVIQHGRRVAANGDVRLEASPGQWSPVPAAGERTVDREKPRISQRMSYPDETKNRKGFNPIEYPDFDFSYTVHVEPAEGNAFRITVDLDQPLPEEWAGRVGFNFELFPGHLFGKSFFAESGDGVFPVQPNGPLVDHYGEILTEPLARGRRLVIAPDDDSLRMTIESRGGALELWDGRANHNNGWYIVRTPIEAGATMNAVEWIVTPHVQKNWTYEPVIQVSQLGYAPAQEKRAIIEQDSRETRADHVTLFRVTENGREAVKRARPARWGEFLRYNYFTFDFSDVTEPGVYVVGYRSKLSEPFRIAADIYDRHAWQPTLEYFLPVQMCHMRVNEKYRVWHDHDHADDALMAPVDYNHIDGYVQGPSTLTKFKPFDHVPGLNAGGWHDAGDYDLRVESQIGTVWVLAKMIEEFGLEHDATLIDQERKIVEIREPDGRNDALQQVEHGLLSVLGGYRALGRLYRGIISPTIRQYVLLGDGAAQTDGLVYDPRLGTHERRGDRAGAKDDRWVFTEENPDRELFVAAGLAAASRVLREYNPDLADEALAAARAIYEAAARAETRTQPRVFALSELLQATGEAAYREALVAMQDEIVEDIANSAWSLAPAMALIEDAAFRAALDEAVAAQQEEVRAAAAKTPYGVPYEPNIWGAGWDIQRFGVRQYFVHKAWPQHADVEPVLNALNFVLGVHPGENTMSFVSGVGSKSALVAYGVNRADWSYTPGGSISGTALIRPDLPELKIWPFFWQQTEYVIGGGATNYMFLALAANRLFGEGTSRP